MHPHIYLIGNAHLDPAWAWQWQEGFAEIKATFRSALDRIAEFPGFVFTSACISYYSREKNCPELILAFKFIYYLFILSILSSRLPSLRHPNLNIVSLTEPGVNGEIDEVYGTLYGFIAQIFTSKTPKPRTMP